MSTNYGFEPTLDGLNNIDADSSTTTNIICDTITVNTSSTVPTMTAGDNTTNIANTAFVTNAISGAGASYVTLTGTQTISGQKTFSNANTFVTGNTVTDSIQASAVGTTQNIATTQINGTLNIGTLTTRTGQINIGTGTSSKFMTIGSTTGGTTAIYGQPLTLDTSTSGTINVGATQTGGTINFGVNSLRTGAININTGTSSTAEVNISSGASGNAPITIGSSASTTQTIAQNGITTFQKIASCSVAPTLGSHLCNKTYVDSVSGVTLAGTNAWTGTNTFNVNLPTSTLTATTSTQFMTKGAVDASFVNLTGSQTVSGAKDFSGNITCSGRLFMIQNNINTLGTTQLGYTALQTLSEFTFIADTWGNIGSIPIPTNGIWICSVSLTTRTTGGAGTVNNRNFVVSSVAYPTAGYDTAIGTLEYYEENDDAVGANGKRFSIGISGVLGANSSTTYYINGKFSITGVTVYGIAKTAITKVG